jgi:hypothetical protein
VIEHPIYDARRPLIVVLDDFFMSPSDVRDEALATKKTRSGRHKGERSEALDIAPNIAGVLASNLRLKGVRGYACYQLCVGGESLVFHSDQQQWAAVAYLTPGAPYEGGTSFFASTHRAHQHVRSSRHLTYEGQEREVYGNKLLDRTAWREVDRIGNVFNRLAIWDARLIHAATEYFGSGPDDGRLFWMTFFDEAP